jgi:hypothetical protein
MSQPVVRFFFACDSAVCDLKDFKWAIRNPWHTVKMPRGIQKGHGQQELWLYAQLSDGLGTFDLGIELQYFKSPEQFWAVAALNGASFRTNSKRTKSSSK